MEEAFIVDRPEILVEEPPEVVVIAVPVCECIQSYCALYAFYYMYVSLVAIAIIVIIAYFGLR